MKKQIWVWLITLILFFKIQSGLTQPPFGAIDPADSAFIVMIQEQTFKYFWNEANPANGLIKDRSASGSPCSIAAVGFGLTAICIGIEHNWITREQGRERVLTTLKTFWEKPQGKEAQGNIGYNGFFYHFLDMNSALRTWNSELSSIDTALLLAGIIYCREYFTGSDSTETQIRSLADSIYFRVDWQWMRNYQPNITLAWSPENGFSSAWWKGYSEAMILNILALGSPTHPAPTTIWNAWTSGYKWETYYGYSYVTFPPLFGHQYSHCWIDFRNIQDDYMRTRGITYFENSVRATLAQRAYCSDNPGNFVGYSENIWGITACDGPNGYKARGAPPAQNDDGTIAPTAAGGSIVFTPAYSLQTLRYVYGNYYNQIWTRYGFRDAFNLTRNWWGPDVIGIDEGPILIMMENYLTGQVWKTFMKNEYIQNGLQRAGFTPVTNIENPDNNPVVSKTIQIYPNYPNPFNSRTIIRFQLFKQSPIQILIYNPLGQIISKIDMGMLTPGYHSVPVNLNKHSSGIYFYQIRSGKIAQNPRMMLLK